MSEILAEPEAQKWAAKVGVPLAFINPSCILGPVLSPGAYGFSMDIMKGFVEGNTVMPASLTGMKVDVRDVAVAHIRAAESPTTQARKELGSHVRPVEESIADGA